MSKPRVCIMEGCDRPANVKGTARGYCIAHYNRIRRVGFAECWALGCHNPVGKYGAMGLCFRHVPEGVAV
jgi:hypothetical protein